MWDQGKEGRKSAGNGGGARRAVIARDGETPGRPALGGSGDGAGDAQDSYPGSKFREQVGQQASHALGSHTSLPLRQVTEGNRQQQAGAGGSAERKGRPRTSERIDPSLQLR